MVRDFKIVKCPECLNVGGKSKVKVTRRCTYGSNRECFHDEYGIYHLHDTNKYTDEYQCSTGHRWDESVSEKCWCGFNG